MKKINFIIWYSVPYTPYDGGIMAMNKLCHQLASIGENAFITTTKKNPKYLGKQITEAQAMAMDKNKSIVIYPEVISGNPCGSKYVMRWLLNTPGVIAGDGKFGETDLIYKYDSIFKAPVENKVRGLLWVGGDSLKIFKDLEQHRQGGCYLIRKGWRRKHFNYHERFDIKLDDYANLGGNEFLQQIFNIKQRFISYDTATYLSIQAALAGCLSVIVPDGKMTAKEFHENTDGAKYGIAYGWNDVEYAKSTQHLVRPLMEEFDKNSIVQTKKFIADAYELINPK